MRFLLFLSFLFLQMANGQAPGPPVAGPNNDAEKKLGSIEGKVVNSTTGEPVRRANLRMFVMPNNRTAASGGFGGTPSSITTTSDADGKFIFDKLEAGNYSLMSEKAGFVQSQQRRPTMFTLGPGQKVTGVELKMTPQAVVSGRVVDEEGEPVANVMIQVMRQTGYARQPMGFGGSNSNDVGEFRIGQLAPGKYLIQVRPHGRFGPSRPAGATEGEARKDYVPTYYPSTVDVSAASPIVVTAGQEIRDIEIRLQKSQVFQIRGKVQLQPGSSSQNAHVMLRQQTQSGMGYMNAMGGGSVGADGTFLLPSVQPGSYYVVAMTRSAGPPQSMGKALVQVTNRDIENVVIEAAPPVVVTGRVIAEGDNSTKLSGQVMLQPVEGISFGGMPAQIGEDGTFKQEGVSRDKHNVLVFGLPGELYVSNILLGNVDVLESGLDLSNAESSVNVEIRVSAKGATVEGIVRRDDKPVSEAVVTLLPHPFRREVLARVRKVASTDQNGRFTIKGITPGEYRVLALQEHLPFENMDPEEIKVFEPFTATVTLKELSREQLELKIATPPEQ